MKELSVIAKNVQASPTMAIDAMFKQLKAEGQDVIGFAAGEPDFNTPDHIKEAAIQAIKENFTRYTPASGILELKQAVCDRVRENLGAEAAYTPEQVVVSSGAKHILYLALRTVINPGDEVVIPTPGYVSYFELVRMVGGIPIILPTTEESGFKPSAEELEAVVTPKTKAVIFNSPCNPTGAVYEEERLRSLADVCVKHDLYILSDEIYDCLVYGEKPYTSMAVLGPQVRERLILVNGVSKAYAMTGWRLGFACAPKAIASQLLKIHQYAIMCSPTTSQYAGIVAMRDCDENIQDMKEDYDMRRRFVLDGFRRLGFHCFEPQGAFYLFPSIQHTGLTSEEFCEKLLFSQRVAAVPGDAFGASGEGFIRVSYCYSIKHLEEALRRIRLFLETL